MSTTVSNNQASNNADYRVAGKVIGGEEFQKIILYDGSGNEIVFPSSVGQKAEAASFPVVLATEQDSVGVCLDDFGGSYNYTAVAQIELGSTAPIPLISASGIVAVRTYDSRGDYIVTAPSTDAVSGLVTRSFLVGLDGAGGTRIPKVLTAAPASNDPGLVARIAGGVGHDITGIVSGRKVVTTAGTSVTLVSSSTPCKKIDIVAETDNTGVIVVGGSGVIAAISTREGVPLSAGQPYSLEIDNAQDVYLDSTVSGDGVTFVYYT